MPIKPAASSRIAAIGPATLAVLLVAGCAPGVANEPALGSQASNIESLNGRSLNGRSLNGRSLNGQGLDGATLTGVVLDSGMLRGTKIENVAFNGSAISGTVGHKAVSGTQLVGSVWTGSTSRSDVTVPVRIDGIAALPAPNAALTGYVVSYQTSSGWNLFCDNEPDGSPSLAIALHGVFDYSQGTGTGGRYSDGGNNFTFACRHYAAAKCVELGYQPWHTNNPDLRPYLQTCTRVLRADYCGDGTPFTVDGTLINLYDRLGLQTDTENWVVEAEWASNGATCIAPAAQDRFRNTGMTPSCYHNLALRSCGKGFTQPNTLMIDEYAH